MRRIVCVIALLIVSMSAACALDLVVDPSPQATAQRLNDSYNRIVNDCKEPDTDAPRGHYYCSGVTLRMVNDGPFLPWTYSPYALQTGATSWTWIRKDLSISVLAHPAGFVLNPPTDAQARGLPALDQGWTCIYTFDGLTGPDRNWYGCGPLNDTSFAPPAQPSTRNKNEEWAFGTCALQNVNSAEQWRQKYPGGPQQPIQTSQCSWNAEVPAQWDAMIAAHEARATTPASDYFAERKYFNEFMLKNLPDSDGSQMKRYIAAFIYQPAGAENFNVRGDNGKATVQQSGVDNARRFQLKLYQEGYAVPVLRIDFKKPPEQRFSYNPADQFVWLGEGSGVPRRYIASATWSQFTDNATGRKVWSLKVIPTARGKTYQANDLKAIFLELQQYRGADAQWKDEEQMPGSMESQLTCIIRNYPGRADWNLEPFRPLVSDAEAKAAGCNPVPK
ncbi:DUF2599 domain-containing protein [Pseudomonas sp. UBA1879]|uniref:DUF2599 domain-containing protein n=1 Tax=Pseudomonas sp. UBA1879 TaxID=1947305 RepID=UPI0025F56B5D|nr:DUF2599 domain-containing protein [Pseudomonas sp. UBA1879]